MAGNLITGVGGTLKLAGTLVASLRHWSIEPSKDVKAEVHSDSGGCDDAAVGAFHWKGTLAINAPGGSMPTAISAAFLAGTLLAFIGYSATGIAYTSAQPAGTSIGHGVILQTYRLMVDVKSGETVAFEFTFQGVGSLTPATI